MLAASYGFFHQGGGWNQAIRMDLTWAMVERGTVAIDAYAANTGDVAIYEGHLYSTKAPGTSFVAVPLYAAMRVIFAAVSLDPGSTQARVLSGHLVTWVLGGCGTAALAWLLAGLARRWYGAPPGAQIWLALAFGLGSLAFPFATVLLGHSLAALFGVAGLYLALPPPGGKIRPGWAGLMAACALVTDYPAAIFLGVTFLALAWRSRSPRLLLRFALGAAGPILVLALYHDACFGSPLATGYDYQTEMFKHEDEAVLLGLFSLPRPERLWAITVGGKRGLFSLYPVCLLGLVAPFVAARQRRHLFPLLISLLIFGWFLLLNASYPVWDGGYSSGPRHLIAGVPLLLLPACVLFSGRMRWPLALLTAGSVAMALAITLVNPLGPYQVDCLLGDYILPALAEGRVSDNFFAWWPGWQPGSREAAAAVAFNLGERLGLGGLWSVIPLLGLWLLAGLAAWRLLPSQAAAD